jgi:hypothetical protein
LDTFAGRAGGLTAGNLVMLGAARAARAARPRSAFGLPVWRRGAALAVVLVLVLVLADWSAPGRPGAGSRTGCGSRRTGAGRPALARIRRTAAGSAE